MTDPTSAADAPTPPRKSGGKSRRSKASASSARSLRNAQRHQARESALQALYEVDVTAHSAAEVLARMRAQHTTAEETLAYLNHLVQGALANLDQIDDYLGTAAPAFPVGQLPAVDRNLLRMAIFELLEPGDVPPKVTINEAVELAKRYGGDNSGRFVNGVLGTVLARIEAERAARSAAE